MCLKVMTERAVRFGELRVIREGGRQPCRTETLGHGWYAIDLAIELMLCYSIAIVDRFVWRKIGILLKNRSNYLQKKRGNGA